MRISDWSSDVCSSDLLAPAQIVGAEIGEGFGPHQLHAAFHLGAEQGDRARDPILARRRKRVEIEAPARTGLGADRQGFQHMRAARDAAVADHLDPRSEEHTSELQSLMRISYAVFCLKKKKNQQNKT